MATQKENGMAFEWAVGFTLSKLTGAPIKQNAFSRVPQNAFDSKMTDERRASFLRAANETVSHILAKEKISFKEEFDGYVYFNSDAAGQAGDVRDVLLHYGEKTIGISCKSNHEALKHPRLSGKLDFVKSWGLDAAGCSPTYWNTINPIFVELKKIRTDSNRTTLWADLIDKPGRFYWPILDAWADEITRLCAVSDVKAKVVCKEMIAYLIGRNDFYKIICHGNTSADIQAFNFNGTLATRKTKYPTFINAINKKNGGVYSKTIVFNHGYSVNFRIHSASSKVEASLKFDINAVGLPVGEVYQQTFEFSGP